MQQAIKRCYEAGHVSLWCLLLFGLCHQVSFLQQVRTLTDAVAKGAIPGVATFCIYGAQIDTPKTFKYDTDIIANKQGPEPRTLVTGKGDGGVNLESLRLCKK